MRVRADQHLAPRGSGVDQLGTSAGRDPAGRPDPDGGDVPWRRLDNRVVWVDGAKALLSVTLSVSSIAVFDIRLDSFTVWPLALTAVVGLGSAIADLVRWLKTRYRVTDDRVELRTGLLVLSNRSVARDRIRSVDCAARFSQRLAGLRIVTISDGQQQAREAAFVLDSVSRRTAETLRRTLLHGRAGTDQDPARDDAEQVLAELRWSWMLYNVVNSWAFFAAALLLWAAYWGAGTFGVDLAQIARRAVDWQALGTVWTVGLAIGAITAVGIVGLAFNFATENWAFRLSRVATERGTALRTSQGLLQTRQLDRDDSRLRGVRIAEPLFWRWIGAADTEVISTGLTVFSVSQEPGSTILPRVHVSEARRVASAVLDDEIRPLDAPLRRHPAAARRRRVLWVVNTTAAGSGLLAWLGRTVTSVPETAWLVPIGLLPISVALAFLAYRSLGHTLLGDYIVVRSGLLSRSTVVLQHRAVIGWTLRQSFFQRRLGLMTVKMSTAAGHGGYQVRDVTNDTGVALVDAVSKHLLAPFVHSFDREGAKSDVVAGENQV